MSDLSEITSDSQKMMLVNAVRSITMASIEPVADFYHVTEAKNMLSEWLDNYYNTPIMVKHGAEALNIDAEIKE